MKTQPSRRQFLSQLAVASTALAAAPSLLAQGAKAAPYKLIAFSKPFQDLTPDQTADFVAEVGWDGIECPVRAKGQILPERVEEGLPKMVEAMKKRGREVTIITTDVKNIKDPLTEKVLRTASKLGIKRYRMGFWKYDAKKTIPDQLKEIGAELRDLAALNKELGLCAGFQNHSGADYVGAPIWDIYSMIKDLDPKHMGICFDIGHAHIEGGMSWPIESRLMEPYYTAVFVKDFAWKKGEKGWKAEWCPLGEGQVSQKFFQTLKKSNYAGPICQHHEYPLKPGKEMLAPMKQDLAVLKQWLAA
jgi:sugar phosphate isomerase/epimerase